MPAIGMPGEAATAQHLEDTLAVVKARTTASRLLLNILRTCITEDAAAQRLRDLQSWLAAHCSVNTE